MRGSHGSVKAALAGFQTEYRVFYGLYPGRDKAVLLGFCAKRQRSADGNS
jgi:hypothetical protein